MENKISIGNQRYDSIIEYNSFYIDKTQFIKEWWESPDKVTVITRPPQFGKTLNMNMVYCFFSEKYKNREDLFQDKCIWQDERYRCYQGTYPVIYISFAGITADNMAGAGEQLKYMIWNLYEENRYLLNGDTLSTEEKEFFISVNTYMDDNMYYTAINHLCKFLNRYYNKQVIILLDSFDSPANAAEHGYDKTMLPFLQRMLQLSCIQNPYMEKCLIMGTTGIYNHSLFTDQSEIKEVSVASGEYSAYFGFTDKEVESSLKAVESTCNIDDLRQWYSGYKFGNALEVYNPWSICNYLKKNALLAYWEMSNSTYTLRRIILNDTDIMKHMEELIKNGRIIKDNKYEPYWKYMNDMGYVIEEYNELDHHLYLHIPNLESYTILTKTLSSM